MDGDRSQEPPVTPDGWYIACESRALRRDPLPTTLLGVPLVLFRGHDGRPAALLDRCPHRNVPLSLGRCRDGELECAYHGWRFDRGGDCTFVPGLAEQRASAGRRAPGHAACDSDGFVWVWGRPESEPAGEPFRFPLLSEPGYTTVRRPVETEASLLDTAENALDVPHTAYLHGGLFRSASGPRNEVEVVIRRWRDRVEAEYIGEPRPRGVAGRFLAPGGGTVVHFDRFVLPSIVQVDYRLGSVTHFSISAALTPLAERRTRMWAVISFRLPVPGGLVKPLLEPLAMRIFGQDAAMLKEQTANLTRFGGEEYKSTEADVLGPAVHRLLRRAAAEANGGESGDGAGEGGDEPVVRRMRLLT
jgi:phenylpropionate dioxygenase-like ring-hydroxylating dioxygenase large terminal subunit